MRKGREDVPAKNAVQFVGVTGSVPCPYVHWSLGKLAVEVE